MVVVKCENLFFIVMTYVKIFMAFLFTLQGINSVRKCKLSYNLCEPVTQKKKLFLFIHLWKSELCKIIISLFFAVMSLQFWYRSNLTDPQSGVFYWYWEAVSVFLKLCVRLSVNYFTLSEWWGELFGGNNY